MKKRAPRRGRWLAVGQERLHLFAKLGLYEISRCRGIVIDNVSDVHADDKTVVAVFYRGKLKFKGILPKCANCLRRLS